MANGVRERTTKIFGEIFMKTHKQWSMILARFQCIPMGKRYIKIIDKLLSEGKNVLVLIKKEDGSKKYPYTQKERFEEFCKLYPEETKNGRIILSAVPDINEVVDWVEGDWEYTSMDFWKLLKEG